MSNFKETFTLLDLIMKAIHVHVLLSTSKLYLVVRVLIITVCSLAILSKGLFLYH